MNNVIKCDLKSLITCVYSDILKILSVICAEICYTMKALSMDVKIACLHA